MSRNESAAATSHFTHDDCGASMSSRESSAATTAPWWIVTTTDAAALKEGWKEIARKWALLWPNGRQM